MSKVLGHKAQALTTCKWCLQQGVYLEQQKWCIHSIQEVH